MPSEALRVVLRNLVANGVAAGATRIHLATQVSNDCQMLTVDDDGCGLDVTGRYRAGAGLGLLLSRRLLLRFDASLELTSGPVDGTRAIIIAPRGAG
jgi:signal transduction histidine kinase